MINFKKIQWGLLASALMVLPACGNDDDDQPASGGDVSGQKLMSTSYYGTTLSSYKYDSKGRLTHFQFNDADEDFFEAYLTIDISYSPLEMKIAYPQDGEETVWSNIVTNSAGYITSAKVTEKFYGNTYNGSFSIKYDSNNRMTSITSEDGTSTLKWNGSKMEQFYDGDGYTENLTYSTTENKTGNVSTSWGGMALYWLTGLFGEVPGYFPSKIQSIDYNNDVSNGILGYKLNDNGSIAKEQITSYEGDTNEPYTLVVDYNYIGGRASDSDERMSKGESSVRFKKPHKMFGLFHRR